MARHKASVSQIYIERDKKVLPDLIRHAKHLATYPTTMNALYQIAAELPTRRFYVGDDAAIWYMRRRLFYKKIPKFINPYKQRLFEALYEEVTKMLETEKYQTMGWKDTTLLALLRPAPCVGLTPSVIGILTREPNRKKRHE